MYVVYFLILWKKYYGSNSRLEQTNRFPQQCSNLHVVIYKIDMLQNMNFNYNILILTY